MIYFSILAVLIAISCLAILFYQKKRKRKLDSQHELTHKLAELITHSSLDAIFLINREYKICEIFNSGAITKFFESPKKLLGTSMIDLVDEPYRNLLIEVIERAFNSHEIHTLEHIVTINGEKQYLHGRFAHISNEQVACREWNITDIKLREEELTQAKKDIENARARIEDAQRINQLILDNTNCGLVYIDPNFIVQFENLHTTYYEGACLKYTEGKYCYEQVKGRSTPCEECVARNALVNKKVEKSILKVHDDLSFQVTASPIFKPDGNSDGIVLRYDNITLQEKTEKELLRAKEDAETSDRMKSLFLSNMSHEIRTPLNAIVGFSDLLAHSEELEEREEYMAIIKRNNELLLQLINDILDLSKIEANRMDFVFSDVDVNQMFCSLEASGNLRLTENPEVDVVFTSQTENYIIHTAENRIQQVLSNFINNAIKFTTKGKIEIGYQANEQDIYFYVSDTGKGIPQDKQELIFTRFTKLDDFAIGTGLGLSICQSIIQKLEGEIGVKSIEGKGSTFWFTLPVKPTKKNRAQPTIMDSTTHQVKTGSSSHSPKAEQIVLIAEDEHDNYNLYTVLLKGKYKILHAWNGEEAVELFEKHRDEIGVILMDIKMPKMNGYEAFERIRKQDDKIPIIAVSAYALTEDVSKIMKSGFTSYISKPINKKKLLDSLEEFI